MISFQPKLKDLGVVLGSFCLEIGSSAGSFQPKVKDLRVVLGSFYLEIGSSAVSFQPKVKGLRVVLGSFCLERSAVVCTCDLISAQSKGVSRFGLAVRR